MKVIHGCGKRHEVWLCDDGTMDTVIEVDGREIRFSKADRDVNGDVRPRWLREATIEACADGLLTVEEDA